MGDVSPTLAFLEKRISIKPRSRILVPGCGFGSDALYLAEKGYQVSAVDWARETIDEVRKRARKKDLEIETLCASVWAIPASWNETFDVWVEHTFFCAISPADRERYAQKAFELLKPGGKFLAALFVTKDPKAALPSQTGGPPFFLLEKDVRRIFEPYFEIMTLKLSGAAHSARVGREWCAHFKRRKSIKKPKIKKNQK